MLLRQETNIPTKGVGNFGLYAVYLIALICFRAQGQERIDVGSTRKARDWMQYFFR
jgi:hypothetical protein